MFSGQRFAILAMFSSKLSMFIRCLKACMKSLDPLSSIIKELAFLKVPFLKEKNQEKL